jgi:GTP-binding protein
MRFIDEAVIVVRSGSGGKGCVSFRREKFVPKGGPDGGDGGRGGDVVFEAELGLNTLLDYHFKRRHMAPDGAPGEGRRMSGRGGLDLVLKVPVGTLIFDENGVVLGDLVAAGQQFVVCQGGHPGKGNQNFALPWRQAPDFASPPGPAVEMTVRLELKLLADIGLVGLPNAGKSTMINRISAAKAKVADYPFTTIIPNLGMVQVGDRSFVVADMPGLIEGAAEGVGLGIQFLRHCERTRALAHLVDVSSGLDPVESFRVVEGELASHGGGLESKPVVVVATKVDMPDTQDATDALKALALSRGLKFHAVSARTGEGIEALVWTLAGLALSPVDPL